MDKRYIYADNAATTPLCKPALDAMLPWLGGDNMFGNPSSIYEIARRSRQAVEAARADIADCIGARANEIYFTSGGTEADNWAIKGTALRSPKDRRHIIVSAVEHHAVLEAALSLEKHGFDVSVLPVDSYGVLQPDRLQAALRPDTALVSVMLANNEIGTIQPVAALAALCRQRKILFHTDAVQAVGHIAVDVQALGVDMLSLSAHKFGGPKGCGALYIRAGVRIDNLLDGGSHERGRRSGTENVAGIVGMAAALKNAVDDMDSRNARLIKLRDRLTERLLQIPYTQPTGHPTSRLPATVSVVINAIEGEAIIMGMDALGIQCSSGSACTSGSLDPSHVLLAIGLKHEIAHGSLRLSLPDDLTEQDVDYIADAAASVAARFRAMSPVWDTVNNRPK